MKYIYMIEFKDDEFDLATATNVEVKQLANAGFQKFDEINGIHIFKTAKVSKIIGLNANSTV